MPTHNRRMLKEIERGDDKNEGSFLNINNIRRIVSDEDGMIIEHGVYLFLED
jgi:hypothetical protein